MADIDITKLTELANSGKLAEAISTLKDFKPTDIIKSLEEVAKHTSLSTDGILEFGKKIVSGLNKAGLSAESLIPKLKSAAEAAKEAFDVGKIVTSYRTEISRVGKEISDLKEKYGSAAAEIGLMSVFLNRTTPPDLFNKMGESAKDTAGSINDVTQSVLKFGKLNDTGFGKYVQDIAGLAEPARRMENQMLTQAAAMGKLDEVYQSAGANLEGLANRTEEYAKFSSTIGAAVGLAPAQMAEAMTKASAIPGMFDDITHSGQVAGKNVHEFQAALEVAAGTGQSYGVVFDDLTKIKDRFATSTEKALEIVARTGAVADATGVKLQNVRKYVEDASNSFGILGNNAQSAIEIFKDMAPALVAGGAGPEQVEHIMKSAVKGITEMTTAQKAFLSASTGGPGGLRGAFEIDYQISQGKGKEVFDKVKQNLQQQIGAPIVTLEQAKGSDVAAAQMQKQISMIRSSSLGGMAKDDASAIKLLEAMAKQQDFGAVAKELKSPQMALKESMDRGQKIQDHSNNVMIKLANEISYMSATQARIANAMSKNFSDTVAPHLTKETRVAAGALHKDTPLTGKGTSAGKNMGDQAMASFGSLHTIVDGIGNLGKAVADKLGATKLMEDVFGGNDTSNAEPRKNKEVEARQPAHAMTTAGFLPSRRVEGDLARGGLVQRPGSQTNARDNTTTAEHQQHVQQHVIHVTCASCNKQQAELVVGDAFKKRDLANDHAVHGT